MLHDKELSSCVSFRAELAAHSCWSHLRFSPRGRRRQPRTECSQPGTKKIRFTYVRFFFFGQGALVVWVATLERSCICLTILSVRRRILRLCLWQFRVWQYRVWWVSNMLGSSCWSTHARSHGVSQRVKIKQSVHRDLNPNTKSLVHNRPETSTI